MSQSSLNDWRSVLAAHKIQESADPPAGDPARRQFEKTWETFANSFLMARPELAYPLIRQAGADWDELNESLQRRFQLLEAYRQVWIANQHLLEVTPVWSHTGHVEAWKLRELRQHDLKAVFAWFSEAYHEGDQSAKEWCQTHWQRSDTLHPETQFYLKMLGPNKNQLRGLLN